MLDELVDNSFKGFNDQVKMIDKLWLKGTGVQSDIVSDINKVWVDTFGFM